MSDKKTLAIDLSGIDIQDIEVFLQEGTRGDADFAASSSCNCGSCGTTICKSCGLLSDADLVAINDEIALEADSE